MKKDVFGRPLETGDLVLVCQRGHRAFALARVLRCTAKRVHVERVRDDGTAYMWTEGVAEAIFMLKAAETTPEAVLLLATKIKESRL